MLNLETAQSPHKLRRVAIEPVSRVEGHGKVTILLDGENRIHQVRLHIVEFRGFEIFIEDRHLPVGPAFDEDLKAAELDDMKPDLMNAVLAVEQDCHLAVTLDS